MVRTFVRAAATLRRATPSSRPDPCLRLHGWALSPQPVSARFGAAHARRSRFSRPGRSCDSRASPSAPGQIYESNGVMLAAALVSAGAIVRTLASAADDEAAHRDALERGLGADVLVTSGGVSVGPHDLVRRIEGDLGVEEVFWRVAVKPGKPISFGVRGGTLVFGLPGNPVSSLVCFELFVRPAVLALQGAREPGPVFSLGELAATVRRNPERDELVRARSSPQADRVLVQPLRGQESHMIARAAGADALVFVPRGEGGLAAGSVVRYLPLR